MLSGVYLKKKKMWRATRYSLVPPPLTWSKSLFLYVDDVAIVEETENK